MATFNLRRFASPDALRNIQEENLRALLSRHASYFTKRGVELNGALPNRVAEPLAPYGNSPAAAAERDGLDYEVLAGVLLAPDDDTPPALVDQLYMIHEMATDEGMQVLLDANDTLPEKDRINFNGASDLSPADVAILVSLKAPEILERKHAEQFVGERKSFEYYLSSETPTGAFKSPLRAKVEALEQELGQWFASKKKGDLVRVFVYAKPDEVWFLVRHGDAFRREGAVKSGQSTSVFYRPEKHDLLVYNPAIGEMRINAGSKGEKELYRRSFGKHLFSGEDHFPSSNRKYTLDPLKADGANSIVCTDVNGIDSIQLTEVTYFWGGAQNEIEVRRAGDVFAALKERDRKIPNTRIIGARFRMKFSDSKTPRSVNLRPPNVAKFTRDDDGKLVEEWLKKRGFSSTKRQEANAEDRAPVARA
ncbi:MAG: hypothetical protein L0216_09535 [Planctomycetales bacterium]|nr:hypothetical protein [Planctomycetales bacterium]